MHINPVMFVSPDLENQFRIFAGKQMGEEIGGFFLVNYDYPVPMRWKKFKSLGIGLPALIQSWIVLPNASKNKARQWSAWDFEKAHEAAEATAHSLRAVLLHFHSHPFDAEITPSTADILFWNKWCDGEGVILTHKPMRLTPYRVEAKHAGTTSTVKCESGEFYGWKEQRFRKLWRETSGT